MSTVSCSFSIGFASFTHVLVSSSGTLVSYGSPKHARLGLFFFYPSCECECEHKWLLVSMCIDWGTVQGVTINGKVAGVY